MSVMSRDDKKDKIKTFLYNSKTHSTLKEKRFVTLYVEHLRFLVIRAGWQATYIYANYYTFEEVKERDNKQKQETRNG